MISENKDLIIKEREITFNLKLKNIPFVNESKVISKQKLIINKNTNFILLKLLHKIKEFLFQINGQYENYPLNNNNCIIRLLPILFVIDENSYNSNKNIHFQIQN